MRLHSVSIRGFAKAPALLSCRRVCCLSCVAACWLVLSTLQTATQDQGSLLHRCVLTLLRPPQALRHHVQYQNYESLQEQAKLNAVQWGAHVQQAGFAQHASLAHWGLLGVFWA